MKQQITEIEESLSLGKNIAQVSVVTLNAFYWYQIFAIDSAVVEVQEMFSSHGSLLTIAMHHHGETL